MLRRSGGFRRHCWMLSARLRLFSSLIVRGRTEAVFPEQSGATMVAQQMQCHTLACERNSSRTDERLLPYIRVCARLPWDDLLLLLHLRTWRRLCGTG